VKILGQGPGILQTARNVSAAALTCAFMLLVVLVRTGLWIPLAMLALVVLLVRRHRAKRKQPGRTG